MNHFKCETAYTLDSWSPAPRLVPGTQFAWGAGDELGEPHARPAPRERSSRTRARADCSGKDRRYFGHLLPFRIGGRPLCESRAAGHDFARHRSRKRGIFRRPRAIQAVWYDTGHPGRAFHQRDRATGNSTIPPNRSVGRTTETLRPLPIGGPVALRLGRAFSLHREARKPCFGQVNSP